MKAGTSQKDKQRLLQKTPTGINGFDEVTQGGLPKGRPTLICGDAIDPRKKLRILTEILQAFPGFDKGILNNIIRVVVINNQTSYVVINFLLIFFQQKGKGFMPGFQGSKFF